jgi:hypothetical protein
MKKIIFILLAGFTQVGYCQTINDSIPSKGSLTWNGSAWGTPDSFSSGVSNRTYSGPISKPEIRRIDYDNGIVNIWTIYETFCYLTDNQKKIVLDDLKAWIESENRKIKK